MAFQDPQKPQPSGDIDFNDAVEQLRVKKGIPKSIVDRLITQESGGDESAVSPKGARGTFQVMPKTFDLYNKKVGGKLDPSSALDRAYVGMSLLQDNYKQFKSYAKNEQHNWGMALGGYHAGPENVMRDLRRGGIGIPDTNDGKINTRDYVYSIMGDVKPESLSEQTEEPQQPASWGTGTIGEGVEVPKMAQQPAALKTPKVTSEVRDVEFEGETPQVPTEGAPVPKPVEFKQGKTTPRKAGLGEFVLGAFDQPEQGTPEQELVANRFKSPESQQIGLTAKISFSPHLNPTEDDLVKGYLAQLGPEYVKYGEKYKNETGRNILSLQSNPEDRDPDGSVYVRPTKGAVDVLNAYVKSGGDINAAKAEGARIATERRGAMTEAKMLAEPDIADVRDIRKNMGKALPAERVIGSSTGTQVGGVLKSIGGAAKYAKYLSPGTALGEWLTGISGKDVGNYFNVQGEIVRQGAELPPLTSAGKEIERGALEKLGTKAANLGMTVGQIILMKKATGLSLGKIMALDTASKTTDLPPEVQAKQIGESFIMGRILEGHLSRTMNAAMFAVPAGVHGAQTAARAKPEDQKKAWVDAAIDVIFEVGAGGLLSAKKKAERRPSDWRELNIDSAPITAAPLVPDARRGTAYKSDGSGEYTFSEKPTPNIRAPKYDKSHNIEFVTNQAGDTELGTPYRMPRKVWEDLSRDPEIDPAEWTYVITENGDPHVVHTWDIKWPDKVATEAAPDVTTEAAPAETERPRPTTAVEEARRRLAERELDERRATTQTESELLGGEPRPANEQRVVDQSVIADLTKGTPAETRPRTRTPLEPAQTEVIQPSKSAPSPAEQPLKAAQPAVATETTATRPVEGETAPRKTLADVAAEEQGKRERGELTTIERISLEQERQALQNEEADLRRQLREDEQRRAEGGVQLGGAVGKPISDKITARREQIAGRLNGIDQRLKPSTPPTVAAPKDIESAKKSLTPEQQVEVDEFSELRHKAARATYDRKVKLTAKEKARFAELDAKYSSIFSRSVTRDVEGKTGDWREKVDSIKDDENFNGQADKAQILRRIADTSHSDKELNDVLDRSENNPVEKGNIAWAVKQNPRASETTKARAADLYEASFPLPTEGVAAPKPEGVPTEVAEPAEALMPKSKEALIAELLGPKPEGTSEADQRLRTAWDKDAREYRKKWTKANLEDMVREQRGKAAPAEAAKPEAEDPVAKIDQELNEPYMTEASAFGLKAKKQAILKGQQQGVDRVPYQQSSYGSLRWGIADVKTGEDVYVPSSVAHPDLGQVETQQRNFSTKKAAQEAIDRAAAPAEPVKAEPKAETPSEITMQEGLLRRDPNVAQTVHRVLAREQEKGQPAFAEDGTIYTKSGKYTVENENGREVLRRSHDLSKEGFQRALERQVDNEGVIHGSHNAKAREFYDSVKGKKEAEAKVAAEAAEAEKTAKAAEGRDLQFRQSEYDARVEATPMPKGKKTKLTLTNGKDKWEVAATVYGDWAIHRQGLKVNEPYTVTHVPTGMRAPEPVKTLADAKRLIKAFIESGVDTSSKGLLKDKEGLARFGKIQRYVTKGGEPPEVAELSKPTKAPKAAKAGMAMAAGEGLPEPTGKPEVSPKETPAGESRTLDGKTYTQDAEGNWRVLKNGQQVKVAGTVVARLNAGEGEAAKPRPGIVEKAAKRVEAKDTHFEKGGKEFGSGGPDTQYLIDRMIVHGWDVYEKNQPKFDEWAKKVRGEFGDEAVPHLRDVYKALTEESVVAPPPAPQPTPSQQPAPSQPVSPSTTSARKAQMAADRAALGLPDLPDAQRKSWDTALANARTKGLDKRADLKAQEIIKNPEALDDEGTAGLVLRAQDIKNDHEKFILEAAAEADPKKRNELRVQLQILEEQFDRISEALKLSGTEKGRALAAQKLTINQDFDLISMKNRYKAKTGKEVKPGSKVEGQLEAQAKQIKELQEELETRKVEPAIAKIRREAQREGRKTNIKVLDAEAVSLKQNIAAEFARLKSQVEKGTSLSQQGLGALDPNGVITKAVIKLARNRIQAGIIKAEDVVDAVYDIVKDVWDDKRALRDAISGYGKTSHMSKDALDVKFRETRQLLRDISAIEDIEGGQRPLRSGLQRDKPSQELRASRARVNEALKEHGLEVEKSERSAAEQQKSALDAAKARARNRIEDLTTWIRDGKRTVASKIEIIPDKELDALKDTRDRLQKVFDGMTEGARNQQLVENAIRSAKKSIVELERKIKTGDTATAQRAKVTSPELEALRAERRILHQILTDLRTAERKANKPPPDAFEVRAKKLLQLRKRLEDQTAEYQRRIREQDFSAKTPREKTLFDSETQKTADKLEAVKNEYNRLVERNKPWSWLHTLSSMRKSGMLTGFMTHVRNIAGTAAYQDFEEARRLPSVVLDAALSQGGKALGYGAQRTVTLSPSAMLDGVIQSFKVGIPEGVEILKKGGTREQQEKQQLREINTGVKAIDLVFNSTFRAMGAADRVFYQRSFKRNMVERAQAQAKTEAANDRSIDWRKRAAELVENPTVELEADAKYDALKATFNNNNSLSDRIKKMRSGHGGGTALFNAAFDMIVPFDRTPTNVIARVMEASPLGFGKNAGQAAKAMWKGTFSAKEQRAFVETFGRATTGTAIMALGFAMVAKGLIETDDYGNALLKVGKRKINLNNISPIGTMLSIGANLKKQHAKDDPSIGNYAGAILKPLADQPILRGTTQISDIIKDPDRNAGKFLGNTAFSMVPFSGAVRTVGQAIDPAENRYPDRSFKQQFQRNIPYWRQSLPSEKEGEFEKKLTEEKRSGKDVDVDTLLSQDRITKSAKEKIEKESELSDVLVRFENSYPDKALAQYERWVKIKDPRASEVEESMSKKAYSLLNSDSITEKQREEFRQRIEALGITPKNPRKKKSNDFKVPPIKFKFMQQGAR